ncbi:MAG: DUF134 domain-containing protein [Desulfarculaceae bacterium]|nr:DUF134 domain-containing protein [Desulfarculaceae bacterium]MCF8046477.1 DUF134 domain-containing protein [Desulfarculaceae bacterium]MCF8096472.1 DUF134 domain-containing protein [Desulfarculaceae bacterium]MCF8121038.1 DUF134 domain-containing protein [Desulfarculaceae bacterium]
MPRNKKPRLVSAIPPVSFFRPQGIPVQDLKGVVLPLEGLEALRLADAEGLDQKTSAARMGVSTATFCRILGGARFAVARALTNGWSIRIEGGVYQILPPRPVRPR